ncbi:MAG TPA: dihydrodipicolinate reductase C-terminal domain-containing protein [Thermoanaerobaculia bacterium]
MKIALHGYGKMGHAVETIALSRGHEIIEAASADVMIDFSHADALNDTLDLACGNGIDLVIGTTGWNARLGEVRQRVEKANIGCVYASNFSPGANVLFALARRAGELFARFPQYAAGIEERHHAEKKDAPSGTALKIAADVREGSLGILDPHVVSSRAGAEFGLHTLFFDSPDDLIELSHRARGRDGFARGAVLAAEMLRGRKGLIRFDELVMA